MAVTTEYRKIGSVAKPHGIRGEFSVFLETDFPDWVARQSRFFAEVGGRMVPWTVRSARFNGDRLLLVVAELPDRTAVEEARRTALYVTEEEARGAVDDPDFFFNSDLIGLAMLQEGVSIGKVRDVFEMPGQNLLEVERVDGETFLFPFADELIDEIDLEAGKISVRLPDGLLDLNPQIEEKPKNPSHPATKP